MHLAQVEDLQKKLDNYDLSVVRDKFALEFRLNEATAAAYEREFKKMVLLRVTQKVKYGIKGQVDDFWHMFILYTELYHDFCNDLLGRYMHHRPTISSEPSTPAESLAYVRLLVDYFRFFKKQPPKDIWPFSHELFGDVEEWEIEGICTGACWNQCKEP